MHECMCVHTCVCVDINFQSFAIPQLFPHFMSGCETGLQDTWSCDFENHTSLNPWCGLTQDNSDNFNWTLQRGPTPSRDTGPFRAQHGDYYIFIETSNPRVLGDIARSVSCF